MGRKAKSSSWRESRSGRKDVATRETPLGEDEGQKGAAACGCLMRKRQVSAEESGMKYMASCMTSF